MEETAKKTSLLNNYYVRIVGTLFVITTVVAILLALVNMVTKPTIAKLAAEKKAAAMSEVMPATDYEPLPVPDGAEGILDLQAAKNGSDFLGYCVQVETNGFGGSMQLMVGVDQTGTVTGVSILKHAETLNTDKHGGLIAQFAGRTADVKVTKNAPSGNQIQAISGATVTSKAVTRGVNLAIAAATASMEGGSK